MELTSYGHQFMATVIVCAVPAVLFTALWILFKNTRLRIYSPAYKQKSKIIAQLKAVPNLDKELHDAVNGLSDHKIAKYGEGRYLQLGKLKLRMLTPVKGYEAHPHQYYTHAMINHWGRTYGIGLDMHCDDPEVPVFTVQPGVSWRGKKGLHRIISTEKGEYSSLERHPALHFLVKSHYGNTIEVIGISDYLNKSVEGYRFGTDALELGFSPKDLHNLYFHPAQFSEETEELQYKGIPVDFVKALAGLPAEWYDETS